MVQKEAQPSTGTMSRWVFLLLAAGAVSIGFVSIYGILQTRRAEQSVTVSAQPETDNAPAKEVVSALGRLEPDGEIVVVSAPVSISSSNRVEQLLVERGDWVEKGQVIAVLDSRDRQLAALERAQTEAQVARANLERIKEGAQEGDIAAQEAVIARLEAELNNARVEYERNRLLQQEGAISESELDVERLAVEATEEQLREARSTLERIREVRPVDIRVAQAELETALAAVKEAEAELALTSIRAPISGQIIEINARSGEVVGSSEGVVEIGRTDRMIVIAEVYETDISKVQPGQDVTITGSAFTGELKGKVSQLGLQVGSQEVFGVDPLQSTDNRVVEVEIELDQSSSEQVSGFSNLQVEVLIDI